MAYSGPIAHAVNFWGDKCGCGWYRVGFPSMALQTMVGGQHHFMHTDSQMILADANFYAQTHTTVVRMQRWYRPEQLQFVKEFLKPLSQQLGMWLVYEIDDVLVYDEIPDYNMAKPAYSPERIGDSPKQIMKLCDLVTVTTPIIKDLYVEAFDLDPERVLVIPNYLPRWWIGESFNLGRSMYLWKEHQKKPRIAFACSTNHFDVDNKNGGIDDFSHMTDWIRKNVDKYQFVFVGGVPKQLTDLVQQRKIEYQPPSDVFNYPREVTNRGFNVLVAPLIDNRFNRCKSNIKYLEYSAIGIPMIGQDMVTYQGCTDLLFKTGEDIDKIIYDLFWAPDAEERYKNHIIENRKVIDGDQKNTGWWLERNLDKWYDLYSAPQKTIKAKI